LNEELQREVFNLKRNDVENRAQNERVAHPARVDASNPNSDQEIDIDRPYHPSDVARGKRPELSLRREVALSFSVFHQRELTVVTRT
jgi:hypothetical protein